MRTIATLATYTDSQSIIVWSIIEINVGVVVACIPAFSPFLKSIGRKLSSVPRSTFVTRASRRVPDSDHVDKASNPEGMGRHGSSSDVGDGVNGSLRSGLRENKHRVTRLLYSPLIVRNEDELELWTMGNNSWPSTTSRDAGSGLQNWNGAHQSLVHSVAFANTTETPGDRCGAGVAKTGALDTQIMRRISIEQDSCEANS